MVISTPKQIKQKKWRNWFISQKRHKKCVNCGERNIKCLDYHHFDNNRTGNTISRMVEKCVTKRKIRREMKKCVVLCANCHILAHNVAEKLACKTKNKLIRIIINLKNNNRCYFCNFDTPQVLRLLHTENNKFNVKEMLRKEKDEFKLLKELEKCILVCANCQRKLT